MTRSRTPHEQRAGPKQLGARSWTMRKNGERGDQLSGRPVRRGTGVARLLGDGEGDRSREHTGLSRGRGIEGDRAVQGDAAQAMRGCRDGVCESTDDRRGATETLLASSTERSARSHSRLSRRVVRADDRAREANAGKAHDVREADVLRVDL